MPIIPLIVLFISSETWIDLGVGSLFELREFNPSTEVHEDYIEVKASNAEELADVSEMDERE